MPGHGGGHGGGGMAGIHSSLAEHHSSMAGYYGELADNYGPGYGLIGLDDDDILYPNKCSYRKLCKHHQRLAAKHARLSGDLTGA
jgi:hypothetical protein